MSDPTYDVAVVGAGPAGAVAARVAAEAGARVVLLDRATFPRYKTCGGGLVGVSQAACGIDLDPLVRDEVRRVTFTKNGRQRVTRSSRRPVFRLVMRDDFDHALVRAALAAGAQLRDGVTVAGIDESGGVVTLRLGGGAGEVTARVVVGADGTGGRTGHHVGVDLAQVDVGLEGEFPTPAGAAAYWRGRVHIDWGPVPGSYAWVFPKGDLLTVGVIGAREHGDALRDYYRDFVDRVGLAGVEPSRFSGHLTRCRRAGSPLRRGRVLVAGDAAGLLEPWTREGISFALRSGRLAGAAAARAAASDDERDLDAYADAVARDLDPEMAAGRRFLAAFERNRQVFHGFLVSIPGGWRLFTRLVAGETNLARVGGHAVVRGLLRVIGG